MYYHPHHYYHHHHVFVNWEIITYDHKDGLKNIKSMVVVDTKVVATHEPTHFASHN
jgi:hypothetical protein